MSTRPALTETFTRHSLFADQVGEGLVDGFPFETVLSFAAVIEHWQRMSQEEPDTYAAAWAEIEQDLAAASELFKPVEDLAVLDRYDDLIARLTRPLFPSSDWTSDARVLSAPFGGQVVCRTVRYEQALGAYAERAMDAINRHDVYARTFYAYKAILGRFFAINMWLDQPLIFVVPAEDNRLSRYFKLNANTNFATIEATGPLPTLRPADVDELLQNIRDLELWQRKLPPSLFRFVGLTVTTLTDVTHETATAAITHLVLTSDANVTEDNFDALEQEVRNLFGTGSLCLGLASLQADGALNARSERRIWNSLVIRDAIREQGLDWRGTLYERALRDNETIIIRDVEDSPVIGSLRKPLLDRGVGSLFLQPLRYKNRTVGLFELSSPEPRVVDASTLLKMQRIQPIFALAVYQNLERFETRVESVIQHTYTAIHPSVAWRFREAAVAMLEREKQKGASESEPVVFEDLYPLYCSADIRGSTRHRNEAIRTDVVQHLHHAREALTAIQAKVPLTILDELNHRLGKRIEQYDVAWHAGDETAATQFITQEVEPFLQSIAGERETLCSILMVYREKTGCREVLRAQAYESSRYQINRLVSAMLLAEQDEAQRLFPHYFEHAKTDGVEHTMYIGQSIGPKQPFDLAYVQNLRLRQLIVSCNIAQQVCHLNQALDMPLDIAQLILVQDAPITLRFRTDEKNSM